MRNLVAISCLGEGSLNRHHSGTNEEGRKQEVNRQELAPPQREHPLLHNQEQAAQGGLMQYRENKADYHQHRQYLDYISVQLLHQDTLGNNLEELQALDGGIKGNTPEYLKEYRGVSP